MYHWLREGRGRLTVEFCELVKERGSVVGEGGIKGEVGLVMSVAGW